MPDAVTVARGDQEAVLADARRGLPDNWTIDGPKRTTKGSVYLQLFGRIVGKYKDREPALMLYKTYGDNRWKVTPCRTYIDPERETLASGPYFAEMLRTAVTLAHEQNERWVAIPGFELPDGGDA